MVNESYAWVTGHIIKLGKVNQTAEIKWQTGLTRAAFFRLAYILKTPHISISLLPVATYGVKTITMTRRSINGKVTWPETLTNGSKHL